MSTLATFISTLGFKMDGSFDEAMKTMAKRISTTGASLEAQAKKDAALRKRISEDQFRSAVKYQRVTDAWQASSLAKSLKESSEALKATQLKRNQAKLAEVASAKELSNMGDYYRKQEAEQAKAEAKKVAAAERERRRQVVGGKNEVDLSNKIERDKMAAALKYQRVMQHEMDRMHSEALRENARRDKAVTSTLKGRGGSSGSSMGLGAFGGIPVMGRTTLGMMAGGFGISEFTRQAYQMANYQAKTMPMLEFITNDKTKSPEQNKATAASEKSYLDAEIKRLSLDRISATKGYTQLAGDTFKTLGSQGTRDLFTSIQEVGLVTGRSSEDMSRAIKAFSQINLAV